MVKNKDEETKEENKDEETKEAVEEKKEETPPKKEEEPLHVVKQVPTEYANVIVNTKTKEQDDHLTALAKILNNTQEILDRL